jgi:3-carboxy-cis,cis-muconate cycloisomerase
MPVRLIDSLATTEALAEIFSDRSVVQAMLDFEIALARVEARLRIIPQSAAKAIARTVVDDFDSADLAKATLRAGTPGIPFSRALTELVRATDPKASGFVHWGATSQDVADTAMILLLKNAKPVIELDLLRADAALEKLAEEHSGTVMLGRTLLQPAPPVTFGLKAAGWLMAIRRGRKRFAAAMDEALAVQLGGASGTLAALGDQGTEVARRVAEELGLRCPDAPWHAQRDQLAAAVCTCGILTGSLAKMARDISLMMQGEIREAAEAGGQGRGGSSTMPQKQNPIGCSIVLAAATRVPGLVAGFLSGMPQEHERAVGGWQAEWATVSSVVQATALAAESVAEIAEGLTVDATRMRNNLEETLGTVLAEKAMIFLGRKIGRDKAHHLLEEATRKAIAEKQPLARVLAAMPEVTKHMDASALSKLAAPEDYLGSANLLLRRQLDSKD